MRNGEDITKEFLSYNQLKNKNTNIINAFNSIGYEKIANKISHCSKDSVFRKCNKCGTYHFISSFTCQQKFCYVCSKKRYLLLFAKFYPIIEKKISEGHKLLFVTFTIKNMDNLKEMLDRFNKTFKKFREKYSIYYSNIAGSVVSREITNIGNGWHVHFHCIFVTNKDFRYSAQEYENSLSKAWLEKTIDSWVVNVKEVKLNNGKGLPGALAELFKYCTKLKEINTKYLKELYDSLYKRRLLSQIGCMYNLVSEDQLEEELKNIDLRDIENLVCAVCGEAAAESTVEYFDSNAFVKTNNKVYSFKTRD